MTVTTVKIHQITKRQLDRVKLSEESYDQAIKRLIKEANVRTIQEDLIEGYHVSGKEQAEEFSAWEGTSTWPA